jgi:hypothetical protein
VASVPASHVYVRHLSEPGDGVVRLPDPVPDDGERVPGGWWPPLMLDPEWVESHRGEFDVFHVHFGFDGKSPTELRELASALDVPLVVTIHDLRNPHHGDAALHDAQLGALIDHAAALVTLTPGAAREVQARWGRHCEVLPHPHVVGLEWMRAARPAHDGFVVGLHAKSLRANMDVEGTATVLAEALRGLPGARLRVNLHDEVSDPASYWYAPEAARHLRAIAARAPHDDLVEHPYFDDEELWQYLIGLDVSVLPYRFGTHSGWLEACHDLGTTVLAPTCGYYTEQRPCLSFAPDDPASLADAVRHAYASRPAWRADACDRMRERRHLSSAHRRIYERLLP